MAESACDPAKRRRLPHCSRRPRSLKRDYRKTQSLSTSMRHGSSRATSRLETTWRGSSRLLPMLQSAMANAQSRWPNKPCNSRAAKMRTISGLSRLSIRRLVGFLRLLQSPNKLQPWLPCRGRPRSRIVSKKTLSCTKTSATSGNLSGELVNPRL